MALWISQPHGATLMVTSGAPSTSSDVPRPPLRRARCGTDHAASAVHFGLIHSPKSHSWVNHWPKWAFLFKRSTCESLPTFMASPLPPREYTDSIIFLVPSHRSNCRVTPSHRTFCKSCAVRHGGHQPRAATECTRYSWSLWNGRIAHFTEFLIR